MSATEVRDEAVELLQRLLRLNTVNPPGNETLAAELLREYLEANGVEVELYARTPERANLVARLRGGDGPSLCFLSHTDTVLADPSEWSRDPWSGDLDGDHVWGRGALDMKNQVAASAIAIASLAREGFRPPGDLVFVAAADEEVGKAFGLQWLCEEHPDAVRVDYAINEGGGERIVVGGTPVYLCASAEKMSSPFTLRVHGRSGHASMPGIADNALVKAARADREARRLRAGAGDRARGGRLPRRGAGRAAAARPRCSSGCAPSTRSPRSTIEPLLAFTLSPTMIDGLEAAERRPGTCRGDRRPAAAARADARGRGAGRCARSSARADYELETIERWGGTRSPLDTPLWDAIATGSRRPSRARSSPRSAAPASPTRTGCATRSARSPTASSR